MHSTSRISTAQITLCDMNLYFVSVYAPSGKNKDIERETLFENDLTQCLITDTDNIILGGDLNCILSPRDTNDTANISISKVLKHIVTAFRYKDIYSRKSRTDFTHYQNNTASRLDRIYLNKLSECVKDVKTDPVSFSDHLCVTVRLCLPTHVKVGRPLWKLNTSLLSKDLIKENFLILWNHLKSKKRFYTSSSYWWETLVKPHFKSFFIERGKEEKKLKYGALN